MIKNYTVRGVEFEVYKTFKELENKYGIPAKYTFGEIHNHGIYLAIYSPELDLIVLNKPILDRIWHVSPELCKKVLRAVCYHEYYHYLRAHGYTVVMNKSLKVIYPAILIRLASVIPILRFWEERNAIKFEYESGVPPEDSRLIVKEILYGGV